MGYEKKDEFISDINILKLGLMLGEDTLKSILKITMTIIIYL